MWNLVVSKPEHHNLRRKTAIKTKFEFSRKKEHALIAGTKLQVEQIKRKIEAKFNKPFFLKIKYFISQNDHKFSRKQLDKLFSSELEGQ